MLLITHGFSGTGKSFHAKRLAEEIGAVHLRSDIERKRLFGFAALDNTGSSAAGGIYSENAGEQTYRHLAEMAAIALKSGFHVILDATFLKWAQRDLFQQLAESLSVPLNLLDFTATTATLMQRIEQRHRQQNDASEATLEILQRQLATAEALSDAEKKITISIDTEQTHAHEILWQTIKSHMVKQS